MVNVLYAEKKEKEVPNYYSISSAFHCIAYIFQTLFKK